jgi:hypothetical protein
VIVRKLLTAGVFALFSFAVLGTPANAIVTHRLEFSFDGRYTPQGSFTPYSLAVDMSSSSSAGDVYLVDNNSVIDKFDASGKYICQITGAGSATTSPSECDRASAGIPSGGFKSGVDSIAIDPANGDLYVPVYGAVLRFSPNGAYEAAIAVTNPGAVAVDGTTGDVYITEIEGGEPRVLRYDPGTDTLSTFATGTSGGPFTSLSRTGLAVDNSLGATAGDVYIADGNGVDRFSSAGIFEERLSLPASDEAMAVVVGTISANVYVAFHEESPLVGGIAEYTSSGDLVGGISELYEPSPTVGLSAMEQLYVGRGSESQRPASVEVFSPGLLIPDVTTGTVSAVGSKSATVEGEVNPAGVSLTECRFVYGPETSYGQSAPCEPAAGSIPADTTSHAVTAKLLGLTPGVTYHYRLEAANTNGSNAGADGTFSTLPAPSIDSAVAVDVAANSADLQAQINPNGYDTKYYFEYGPTAAYGTRIPAQPAKDPDIGAGTADVAVSINITNLSANTTYHWRVVAINANGSVGEDHTLVYDTSGAELPDGRAYELVSSPHKDASLLGDDFLFGPVPEISEDGDRVMMIGIQCFGDAASCTAIRDNHLGSPYEAVRSSGGWQTTALSPPISQLSESGYLSYETNSGTALFEAPTQPHGEDDFYLRQAAGAFADIGPVTPPLDGATTAQGEELQSVDGQHFVWAVKPAWPFDQTEEDSQSSSVYEYPGFGNSQPLLVGVSGDEGSTDLISRCSTELPRRPGYMSSDGRTVFFVAKQCNAGGSGANQGVEVPADELLARVDGEGPEAHTVLISRRSPAACTGACLSSVPAASELQEASTDGSKVVFSSKQRLMDEASEGQENIYLYDFDNPAGHELIDVSAGDTSGHGPGVIGMLTVAPDGSHVYFAARGVLTDVANAQGQQAREGQSNLYVYERDAEHPQGRIAFIAVAHVSVGIGSSEDDANVTPNGMYLAFTSANRLTSDDTSVSGAKQVFRYDAETGELTRISIGNDGFNDNGNRSTPASCQSGESRECESARTAMAGSRERRDPTMSNDGSYVFFQSPVGLTPKALDRVPIAKEALTGQVVFAENVYEWHDGHVYLISDGRDTAYDSGQNFMCHSGSTVCLFEADATGHNVLFSTADSLVPEDTDTQLDYYDARICTDSEPCIKPSPPGLPPCLGETCHGTPSGTPLAPGVPSMTFNGQGNVLSPVTVKHKFVGRKTVKCTQKKVRVRGKCVKRRTRRVKASLNHRGKGGRK